MEELWSYPEYPKIPLPPPSATLELCRAETSTPAALPTPQPAPYPQGTCHSEKIENEMYPHHTSHDFSRVGTSPPSAPETFPSQGEAKKDQLSSFPILQPHHPKSVLVTSPALTTSPGRVWPRPWGTPPPYPNPEVFCSFSTTASQGWVDLREFYRAMSTDPPKISRKGPPSLCRKVPSLWKELQGELRSFLVSAAARAGDTPALHPSLGSSPHPRPAPGLCVSSRNKAKRAPGSIPKAAHPCCIS